MMTWVLVANSATAVLYNSANLRTDNLHIVKEYQHPDSRKKISDLISDKPGRYNTDSSSGGGSYENTDPKKITAEHFALELIKEMKTHCPLEHIKSLIIVAPDGFYKFIKQHFAINSHNTEKLVHIAKDYTKYTISELTSALKEHILAF